MNRSDISLSGKLLVASSGNRVRVWDIVEQKELSVFAHPAGVFSVTISPDERLVATGADDNIVRLFESDTGELIAELEGHGQGTIFLRSAVYSIAFSPNGKWLASGGHDGRVIVWDIDREQAVLKTQIVGPPIVHSVTFSPNSKLIVGGFENAGAKLGIRVWQVPTM